MDDVIKERRRCCLCCIVAFTCKIGLLSANLPVCLRFFSRIQWCSLVHHRPIHVYSSCHLALCHYLIYMVLHQHQHRHRQHLCRSRLEELVPLLYRFVNTCHAPVLLSNMNTESSSVNSMFGEHRVKTGTRFSRLVIATSCLVFMYVWLRAYLRIRGRVDVWMNG